MVSRKRLIEREQSSPRSSTSLPNQSSSGCRRGAILSQHHESEDACRDGRTSPPPTKQQQQQRQQTEQQEQPPTYENNNRGDEQRKLNVWSFGDRVLHLTENGNRGYSLRPYLDLAFVIICDEISSFPWPPARVCLFFSLFTIVAGGCVVACVYSSFGWLLKRGSVRD